MGCKCNENKDVVRKLAVNYAKLHQCDVLIFKCAETDFCELSIFDYEHQIIEVIYYDNL